LLFKRRGWVNFSNLPRSDLQLVSYRVEDGKLWRDFLPERNLELAEDLPALLCYPGPLSQVLINLMVNATHAIQARACQAGGLPGGGQIDVSTALAAPGCIEIRVRDNGGGMPDHVRARIFERYFTTKPQGMGTGQGLAIAQDIVVGKHGGELSFETELGCGTTFSIRLPVERRPSA